MMLKRFSLPSLVALCFFVELATSFAPHSFGSRITPAALGFRKPRTYDFDNIDKPDFMTNKELLAKVGDAMTPEFKIVRTLMEDGRVKMEIKGMKGPKCSIVMAEMRKILSYYEGAVFEDEIYNTEEFHEHPVVQELVVDDTVHVQTGEEEMPTW